MSQVLPTVRQFPLSKKAARFSSTGDVIAAYRSLDSAAAGPLPTLAPGLVRVRVGVGGELGRRHTDLQRKEEP